MQASVFLVFENLRFDAYRFIVDRVLEYLFDKRRTSFKKPKVIENLTLYILLLQFINKQSQTVDIDPDNRFRRFKREESLSSVKVSHSSHKRQSFALNQSNHKNFENKEFEWGQRSCFHLWRSFLSPLTPI